MQFVAALMLGLTVLYVVTVSIFFIGRHLISPIQRLTNQAGCPTGMVPSNV